MNAKHKSALIKDMLDLAVVATAYGLDFNRAGFARCPFHAEKTASFKIKNRHSAHCFGCGWSGDVISFTGQLFNLDFEQSTRKLINDFNLPIVADRKMTLREDSEITATYNAAITEYNKCKQAEKELQQRYERLLWVYATLDKWKYKYAPENPTEPLDEHYIIACKEIDGAAYRLMLYS